MPRRFKAGNMKLYLRVLVCAGLTAALLAAKPIVILHPTTPCIILNLRPRPRIGNQLEDDNALRYRSWVLSCEATATSEKCRLGWCCLFSVALGI